MKILLLGAGGMIGNGIAKIFSEQKLNFVGTVSGNYQRTTLSDFPAINLTIHENLPSVVTDILRKIRPTHVVNCIGIIKPADNLTATKQLYLINSAFPQVLVSVCGARRIRLIHMSTDCVFSGARGAYKETDIPDDTTEYGKSKFLGEIRSLPHVTIRTSVIGRELHSTKNLLDWFLHTKQDRISGYANAMWNGVSSLCIGRIISRIITDDIRFDYPIVHVSGEIVSKYELLTMFKTVFYKRITIMKHSDVRNDKTLIPNRKQSEYFGDIVRPIREQIKELSVYYNTKHAHE